MEQQGCRHQENKEQCGSDTGGATEDQKDRSQNKQGDGSYQKQSRQWFRNTLGSDTGSRS